MTNDVAADDDIDADDYSEPSAPTPRWQRVFVLSVAALAIAATAFAIGRFTAFDATAVPPTPSDTSAEAGFARDMQVHHQQAVQMALIIYPKTTDPDLRALSYDLATSQASQLGQMQQWLLDWNLPAFSSQQPMQWMSTASGHEAHGAPDLTADEIKAQMGMASDEDIAELSAASGDAASCQFLSLMIRHHEGAIEMVDAIEQLGSNATVLDLAGKMSASQSSEIAAMKSLQVALSCAG